MIKKTLLLLLFSLSSLSGEDNCHQITLEMAKKMALTQNPNTRIADEGITSAKEEVGIAKSPYYPTLNFEASYSRWQRHLFFPKISSPTPLPFTLPTIIGPTNDWNFAFSSRYVLFDSGERYSQLMAAYSRRDAAQDESDRIKQELLLDVSLAYFSLLGDYQIHDVTKQALKRAEDHLKLTEQRYAAGDVPFADVLRSRVTVSDAKLNVAQAEAQMRTSQGNLNVSMGWPPQYDVHILDPHMAIIPPKELNVIQAECQAAQNRPEVKAEWARVDESQHLVDLEKSAFGPRLTLEGGYGRRDDNFFPRDEEWLVGIYLRQSILSGYSTVHSVRRAKSQASLRQAQWQAIQLKVQQQVWDAYSKMIEAFEAIELAKARVHDAAESLRLIEERYKLGAATITDLLDTQTEMTRAQVDQAAALWHYHSAYMLFLWAQGAMDACD